MNERLFGHILIWEDDRTGENGPCQDGMGEWLMSEAGNPEKMEGLKTWKKFLDEKLDGFKHHICKIVIEEEENVN